MKIEKTQNDLTRTKNLDVSNLLSITDWIRFGTSALANYDVSYHHIADGAHEEAVQLTLMSIGLNQVPDQWTDARLTDTEMRNLKIALEKRCFEKVPTSYITNRAMYADIPFYIDERALIPRSPIQQLIRDGFSNVLKNKPKRVLDMCAGSGCIGMAMAMRMESIEEVVLADISDDAIEVAKKNIEMFGLQDKVKIVKTDMFENIEGEFDLIVTNPPYITDEEYEIQSEETKQEPHMALVSPDNGMYHIRNIMANAGKHLTDNGVLICEVMDRKSQVIEEYPNVKMKWLDLTGHPAFEFNIFGTNKGELKNV
jgi:ribosomal protein L3 glutamine methyltransferase